MLELIDTVNELAVNVEQISCPGRNQLAAVDVIEQLIEVRKLSSRRAHSYWLVEGPSVLINLENST